MGILKRIATIIEANLDESSSHFDDPEGTLHDSIREMREALQEATESTAQVMASEKLLRRDLAAKEQEAGDLQRQAEQAVDTGDDSLARKALSEKQSCEVQIEALREQLAVTTKSAETLRQQVDGMQARLQDAERQQGELTARARAAELRKQQHKVPTASQADHDPFAKFDRMREKVEIAEAEADALAELHGDAVDRRAVTSDPEPDSVEDELEALKKKVQQRPSG